MGAACTNPGRDRDDGKDENGRDRAPTMPPMRLYKKSPMKAIKRFRLPAAGKKLYDLQREREKMESKQRRLEQDRAKFTDKIAEYQSKLAQAEADHIAGQQKLAAIIEELHSASTVAAQQLGELDSSPRAQDSDPAGEQSGTDDNTECAEYLEFDSDDEEEWENAQREDPHLFDLTSPVDRQISQMPSASPEEALTPDQLRQELPVGTSVLHPKTWKPLPEMHQAHCWENAVDTDLFVGTSMLFLRDKDPAKNGKFQEQIWAGKNRVYTLQVQGKFKRRPKGPLCFYLCALDDVARLGTISKRLGKMWLSFARNWEPKIDINFKNEPGKPLSLLAPISPSWMGIIETPPGDELPKLGHRLPSYKECIRITGRDLGNVEDPNLDATYTFEFYTANLNCIDWKFCNIPVLPEIRLANLAPAFAAVANTSGYVGCLREMGDEDEKFLREGTGGTLAHAHVIHREAD